MQELAPFLAPELPSSPGAKAAGSDKCAARPATLAWTSLHTMLVLYQQQPTSSSILLLKI
jgi:hypothetical protein